MLVLSRFKNEVICLGDDIRITICDVKGDKVKVGIEAPNEMPVHRKEIYDMIRRDLDERPS